LGLGITLTRCEGTKSATKTFGEFELFPIVIKEQVSAIVDEPARRAASRQTCCKQRWTLSGINFRPNYCWQRLRRSTFRVIARCSSKVVNLHLALPLGLTQFEFCRDLQHQKIRVPGLSCGVLCVVLCFTVSASI